MTNSGSFKPLQTSQQTHVTLDNIKTENKGLFDVANSMGAFRIPSIHLQQREKEGMKSIKEPQSKPLKENRPPTLTLQKQGANLKVIHHKADKIEAQRCTTFTQTTETEATRSSFSLKSFNSIMIGPKPNLGFSKRPQRNLHLIQSTKPVNCTAHVQGLTIKLKITN